jgi:hypothetical protein
LFCAGAVDFDAPSLHLHLLYHLVYHTSTLCVSVSAPSSIPFPIAHVRISLLAWHSEAPAYQNGQLRWTWVSPSSSAFALYAL